MRSAAQQAQVPSDTGLGNVSQSLDTLATLATELGHEIVDIAGNLDHLDQSSQSLISVADTLGASAGDVLASNTTAQEAIADVAQRVEDTATRAGDAAQAADDTGRRIEALANWVRDLSARMGEVSASLDAVQRSNAEIAAISEQVNVLAINAKIEAVRAGNAGQGFGVVAEAITELSGKTAEAANGIEKNSALLSSWMTQLRNASQTAEEDAGVVLGNAREMIDALATIKQSAVHANDAASRITVASADVDQAARRFGPEFDRMRSSLEGSASAVHDSRGRVNALIDRSEGMVQASIALGGTSADGPFIERVKQDAAKISQLLDAAVDSGEITIEALFDDRYKPIPGTRPEQVMTRFTALTDRLLPPVQEAALDMDPTVVFCAAVDRNGYLPTHNRKFSQPQGNDETWNMANCRNRRMFDDRVGLKAGRSLEPFLLQVYRRDMGGGEFAMMKDLSAPISVKGRHWGGLRLAYRF